MEKTTQSYAEDVYRCSKKELIDTIREKLGNDLLFRDVQFKIGKDPSVKGVSLDTYNSIYNYIGSGRYEVILVPKRYCNDRGVLILEDREEILALYRSRDKTLEGSRAISKIKAIFAVSEIRGFIRRVSDRDVEEYIKNHPRGVLRRSLSLEDLIKEVKSREPNKMIYNDNLMNILTEEPALIEIDGNMYIIIRSERKIII